MHLVSVPRRGFVVFLLWGAAEHAQGRGKFQSPEGDSLFFYAAGSSGTSRSAAGFSPPKGIRCFSTRETLALLCSTSCFSPPKGIRCFSTSFKRRRRQHLLWFQSPEGDSLFFYEEEGKMARITINVSVPRRGFVVFLLGAKRTSILCQKRFQSPEGDSLFFYK